MFLSPELGVLVTALGAEAVVAAVVGEVGFTTVAAAVEGAAHGGGAAVEEGPRSLAMAARDLVSMSMRLDTASVWQSIVGSRYSRAKYGVFLSSSAAVFLGR